MPESAAAPLPRTGQVFFDVRGSSRTLRLSWYADTGVAVFSIWQGDRCTATFRLPLSDLPRMIETLQTGPDQPGHPPGHGFQDAGYLAAGDYADAAYRDPGYPGSGYQDPGYPADAGHLAEPVYPVTAAWPSRSETGHRLGGRADEPEYPTSYLPDSRYPAPRHLQAGVTAAGRPDSRYPDPGSPAAGRPDSRYPDPRHLDAGVAAAGRLDSRYPDPRHLDAGVTAAGRPDSRYPDPRHLDAAVTAAGRPDSRYPDPGRGSARFPDGHVDTGGPAVGLAEAGRGAGGFADSGRAADYSNPQQTQAAGYPSATGQSLSGSAAAGYPGESRYPGGPGQLPSAPPAGQRPGNAGAAPEAPGLPPITRRGGYADAELADYQVSLREYASRAPELEPARVPDARPGDWLASPTSDGLADPAGRPPRRPAEQRDWPRPSR